MNTLKFKETENTFKILNATNGGPWYNRRTDDQLWTNFEDYKAARIPYSRNHDSSFCSTYGGPHAHDITGIFPDFSRDAEDPESYDFACTDESILSTLEAGTETFYRLGQAIEHGVKKYGTIPPADFRKWAVICEHIIRHYNEGWADGYHLNIRYWEIWNEPDLDPDDSTNKRTWGGTKLQFFDLYEITAKHLKQCFPELKIGGPALAGDEVWAADFLKEMKKRGVPIDFFSWHIYCTDPEAMTEKALRIRKLLKENGYGDAESILNEWNYVRGWTVEFIDSIKTIIGMKGAAFTAACIASAQKCDGIDMLMYYDTRPSVFNGVFDFYTCERRKCYYPLMWYGMFYDLEGELRCNTDPDHIYTLCGRDRSGKILCMAVCYSDSDEAGAKEIALDFGRSESFEVRLLDETHDGELIKVTDDLKFSMKNPSCLLLKEV